MVQAVCRRVQQPVPSAVMSSTDTYIMQLLECAQEEGDALATWPDCTWQALTVEANFTTLASNDQGAVPADFSYMIPMTIWNRTMNRQVWGPMDEEQWQRELAGPTFTSPYYALRLRGNHILLTPVPAAGNSVYYEYTTVNWIYGGGGSTLTLSAFANDTDTTPFPEKLFKKGIEWRFKRKNGFDYAQEYDDWMALLQPIIARNKSAQRLSATERYPWNRRTPFIPSGSWNV